MSFLDKLRKVISEDEETKNLEILDKDVILVYDYIQKKRQNNQFGYRLVLKTKPFIHTVLMPTEATEEIEFQQQIEKQQKLFNYELNLEDISLKKFKINESSKEELIKEFKKMLLRLKSNSKGFYLYGRFSTGKTFFLKIIAKILMQKQIPFIFILMSDLVRQFKLPYWCNDVLENKLNNLKKIPYLFLDDLGSEQMNSNFRDDFLFPLLNYRFDHKKPIFISSNIQIKDLVEHFESQEFNSSVKAHKIVSRINDLTKFYQIDTPWSE